MQSDGRSGLPGAAASQCHWLIRHHAQRPGRITETKETEQEDWDGEAAVYYSLQEELPARRGSMGVTVKDLEDHTEYQSRAVMVLNLAPPQGMELSSGYSGSPVYSLP